MQGDGTAPRRRFRTASGSFVRVMFVDDDEAIRRSIGRATKRAGVPADLVGSAEDAIKLAATIYYPIVVTDLRMPGMDGIELMRRLRTMLEDCVFVVITGQSRVEVPVEGGLRDSVASILEKPWDDDELLDTLHRAMRTWEHRRGRRHKGPVEETEAQRILLLEDDDMDFMLVNRMLRGTVNPTLTRAQRLSDALSELEQATFDVIICDLTLPDARGLDTVLRLQNAAPNCPLIVLSGSTDDTVALQALRAGAQEFLVKDRLEPATLERAIRYASERKNSEHRLTLLALNDPLTGLANRTALRQALQQRLRRARRSVDTFALMFVDLDGFKGVNDGLGHAAGDALLIEIGRRLMGVVREYDTVARLGGDEFAVILDSLPEPDGPLPIARRLLAAMSTPVALPEGEATVSGSIGIAVYPDVQGGADDLLRAADKAMYRAKSQGKNTFSLHRQSVLPSALAPRRSERPPGDVQLRYEVQRRTRDGKVVALGAGVFVKQAQDARAAHEAELRGELGRLALRAACADLRRLQGAGLPIEVICLPLPSESLEDAQLAATVGRALEHEALAPGSIQLRFEERALLGDVDRGAMVEALDEAGAAIALDNFGTGQISLPRLFTLPIQQAWVSPAIVQRTLAGDLALLRALVGMCIPLGIELCAHGVESEPDRVLLASAGCERISGPIFGSPVTGRTLIEQGALAG